MRRLPLLLLLILVPSVLRAAVQAEPIELSVDAGEAPRKLLHARMRVPASPGALTLVYPKWLPGAARESAERIEFAPVSLTGARSSSPG